MGLIAVDRAPLDPAKRHSRAALAPSQPSFSPNSNRTLAVSPFASPDFVISRCRISLLREACVLHTAPPCSCLVGISCERPASCADAALLGVAQESGISESAPADCIFPFPLQDLRTVQSGADVWYYLHCIKFIHEVKSGQLAENSPMLNDISGSPTWQRINAGMLKMYFAEVMDKLPVIQHMLFGSIFTFS